MAAKTSDWRPGPTVCRCCFADGCYKDISTEYFWMGKREVYSEMLSDTFDVSIAYAQTSGPNSNSRLICEPCISRLRDASDFKRQVQECEKVFLQHLAEPGSSMEYEILPETSQKEEVKLERVKIEAKLDDDDDDFDDQLGFDDDDDDDMDDEPLTKFASKIPKAESDDLINILQLGDDTKKPEKRKSSTKVKLTTVKKAKKKESPKPSASKAASKPVVEKKKKGTVLLKWKPKKKYLDQRGNAAIIIECSNVCPFRWSRGMFTCGYCSETYENFDDLRAHTKRHSNRIATMRFAKIYDQIKIEISDLRCQICLESMTDLESLKSHLGSVHDMLFQEEHGLGVTPFILTDQKFGCAVCYTYFEKFHNLNSHMNEHFQYNICFKCGKFFSSAHRLKSHLAIHENTRYKCPKCPQIFTNRVKKNNHVTMAHGPGLRYRCPICKETFKSYSTRIKHMEDAHDRKQEYACHLCPAVFPMCNRRTKHIQMVHVKNKTFSCESCFYQCVTAAQLRRHMVRHQTERNFECTICKKCFPRAKALKEHSRIHSNDRRFSCEYCAYSCIQKCSLKNHLKTHHVINNQ